jgi:hypothetical protein
MIALRLQHRSKVHLTGSLLVPLSAHAVWGQMRHFTYFVGLDPFHANVRTVTGSIPTGAGTPIVLGHRFGPFRLDRVGRILPPYLYLRTSTPRKTCQSAYCHGPRKVELYDSTRLADSAMAPLGARAYFTQCSQSAVGRGVATSAVSSIATIPPLKLTLRSDTRRTSYINPKFNPADTFFAKLVYRKVGVLAVCPFGTTTFTRYPLSGSLLNT